MYVAQRILSSLLVIAGTLVLVFAILYVLPGDPTDSMIDPSVATAEQIANLKHQLVTLEKYVRFYFVAGTLLTPLAYFAACAIVLLKTPVSEPGFPDPSQLIDAQIPVVTQITKHRFFLMYALVGVALTISIYFLNRWYVNKLYGQHIQKLKELLLQMEEADES